MTTSHVGQDRSWAYYTEPKFIEVDGLDTAYRREGRGDTVVYLHGGGLTRAWLPFFAELAAGHDVVVPEHPGFGDTPLGSHIEDFSDLVLHYDGLFDALGLERFHLVGHSLGGWIAANLAVFYPRRFASLTLVTPAGLRVEERVDEVGVDPFRWEPEEAMEALLNGRYGKFTEFFEQEGFPGDAVQAYREATTMAHLTWNPRYDRKLDHRLRRVAIPTLVLGAEDDRVTPNAIAAKYADLIPGARLHVVRGEPGEPSGHLIQLEYPDRVAALIADHVAANG